MAKTSLMLRRLRKKPSRSTHLFLHCPASVLGSSVLKARLPSNPPNYYFIERHIHEDRHICARKVMRNDDARSIFDFNFLGRSKALLERIDIPSVSSSNIQHNPTLRLATKCCLVRSLR